MIPGRVLVVGCGNLLFGDDGFGPGVIEALQNGYQLPENIEVVDAGTGAGDLLLDALLGESVPQKLILIDAMDFGLTPGTVREVELEKIPIIKRGDFSVHQFPGLDILQKLRDDRGVDVYLLGCQIASIPEEIEPGLSRPVAAAVMFTAEIVHQMVVSQ